ncbi:MAG: hypothetical protein JKX70_04840 [Phycisphaerales bacterium]|nr:hypothetical protein [Phycisphaerales bacterium]
MTHDQNHPEHAQENGQPMNIAALLRAAADGELTDCQCEELDAYMARCPDTKSCAESQIAFEKAMQDCCGRAMSKPCCPDALREKIMAIAANAPENEEAFAQGIEAASAYTKSPSFWSRSPMMGVAAAMLIVVAGTLIWQSASLPINNAPAHLNVQQASYYNRVSDFVVREHNRCRDDDAAQAKLVRNDIDMATAYFTEVFGHQLVVPDMDQVAGKIEFYGGGDCSVPSTSRSGHLRFDAIAPDGQRISLSLFVSPDPGLLPMEEGMTYTIDSKACQDAGARLFAWVNDGIQYLLVSEADEDMCAIVREMMQAPSTVGSI